MDPYINVYTFYFRYRVCDTTIENSCKLPDIIAFVIRLILGYFDVTEACRSFSLLMITLFLWLEMQTKYFERLKSIQNNLFFPWYHRYQLALRTWEKALFEWIRILMGTFFVVIVVCNVVSVKYVVRGRMPAYVAWLIPSVSILYMSTVYLLFPYIMGSHEDTEELLRRRRYQLFLERKSRKDFEVQRRMLVAIRPISLRCGDSFILKKETKSAFYGVVVARTIDGILMKY